MKSVLRVLKKPFSFVAEKFHRKKETQAISPSDLSARRANVFHSILSPFETYVVSFQSLLIWEQPFLSATAFVSINIVYWLIVSWNRRLFSILSIFVLVIFGYRTWVNQIWPEIRVPPEEGEDTESWTALKPGVLSVPEVSRYLNEFCEKMVILWKDVWKLRKENHGLFCALMCGFFSILALIGKVIPGVLIIYSLVLLVSLGPGIALHLLPAALYDQMIGFFAESDSQTSEISKCGGSSDKDSDIEEFVPEASEEILKQLTLRDEVPEVPSPGMVLTETGSEDYLSINEDELALYQGLGAFPSIEEDGESDLGEDAISESEIMPSLESSENNGIHFVPTHFKEDSSESESDAVFTEGLSFTKNQAAATVGSKTSVSQTAEENIETVQKRRKSSLSDLDEDLADFEILEESDLMS